MSKFQVGDRVVFLSGAGARQSFWEKKGHVAEIGTQGDIWVKLDEEVEGRTKWHTTSNSIELEGVSEEEMAEVLASLASVSEHSAPTTPAPFFQGRPEDQVNPPSSEEHAVAAFLQGGLAMTCQKMVNEPMGLKIARVEQLTNQQGDYQDHFVVVTESGIRIKVQVTPEEGS